MKRGRPSIVDQQKLRSLIFEHYEKDISAIVTAKECDVQCKTVRKYYKTWDNEPIDDKDFLVRIKNTKERAIQSFDKDIITLDKDVKRVEFLINKSLQKGSMTEFEKLTNLKLKMMGQKAKIVSTKVNLVGTPTADVIINQKESIA
jgi:hypothetical protein